MNKSEVLRALEWVDQAARDGNVKLLSDAKRALETELASKKNLQTPEEAQRTAFGAFVRKHGREPLEEIYNEE